jgi:rare lipoprotein A
MQYKTTIIKAFIGLQLFAISMVNSNQKENYTKTGTASYYAKKFNNRRTTSGELFCNDSLTGAHKTLAFGSIVKVTNLKNDSVVLVKINDRLPKKSSRLIDLSQRAAKQLNFIKTGIVKVRVELLK